MKPAKFEYRKPASLDEALEMISHQGGEAKILAGGQSLVPMMNFRVARPDVLVDINALPELDYIERDGTVLKIGALARHAVIKASPEVQQSCPLVSEAYEWVAHHPIRTRGTLCGNLCHADPASEMPAVMIALGAEFVLLSARGQRVVPATEFFLGIYETAIEPDELLAEVRVPVSPATQHFGFIETSMRRGDFAMCCAIAVLDISAGQVQSAAIAVAGIYDMATRLTALEQSLIGISVDTIDAAASGQAARTIEPVYGDQRMSAQYKEDLLEAHVRQALEKAVSAVKLGEPA